MKKILTLLFLFFAVMVGFAQAPNMINYQGIARNSVGNVLPNQPISIKLSIRDLTATGAVVYSEIRNVTTNFYGLFSFGIGSPGATGVTGTIAGVNWGVGAKFLQVEIDPAGGSSFTNVGTTQLLSVPYALFSNSANPAGPAGGDLSGTYPNPTVARIRGVNVLATAPTNRQVLKFNGTDWVPAKDSLILPFNGSDASALSFIIDNTRATGQTSVISAIMRTTTGVSAAISGIDGSSGGVSPIENKTYGVLGITGNTGIGVGGYAVNGTALRGVSSATGLALHTNGPIRLQGISEGLGKVLTSDASGNATWQIAAAASDLVLPFVKTQSDAGLLFSITNTGTGGSGSFAINNSASTANALIGTTNGTAGIGVLGVHSAATGVTPGVRGETNSTDGNAVAVQGVVVPTSPGGFSAGVRGVNNGTGGLGIGVYGEQAGSGWGVYGTTPSGIGVHGNSTNGFGVLGLSTNGFGVYGSSTNAGAGRFEIFNSTNTADALTATTVGTGFAANFVSANATTPKALRTVGGVQLTGIGEALNRVLTSDAAGNATWQAIGGGGLGAVTGSGTLNYVPKWTPDGNTLGNSLIFDNGTNVGIGTITPSGKLNVLESGTTNGGINVQLTGASNTNSAINVTHAGTGDGANIQLTNAGSGGKGVDVLVAGVGTGVFANSAGGSGVWGITSSISAAGILGDNTFGEAVVGRNRGGVGVGSVVGRNDSSGYGVRGFNTKTGIGVLGQTGISGGQGRAGRFENVNAANSLNVVEIAGNGTGTSLHVSNSNAGVVNLAVFNKSGANVARISGVGEIFANGGFTVGGADIAEYFAVEGLRNSYEAGDVLVISQSSDRMVEKSSTPYSTLVSGVYATKAGMKLTEENAVDANFDSMVPMGVIGVIPTKVCTEGGNIKRGDLLVTSSTVGVAMKADPEKVRVGQVLGKALQDFNATKIGKINVLVSVK